MTKATTDKTAADKVLATAKATLTKATTNYSNAEAAAKAAEAKSRPSWSAGQAVTPLMTVRIVPARILIKWWRMLMS